MRKLYSGVAFLYAALMLAPPLFASYKLTLQFSGMTPNMGQMLEIRAVDKGSGFEVGRTRVDTIKSDAFNVNMYVLIPDSSYRIDFYADVNENDMYDAPSTDHAWRLNLDNVTGDEIVPFARTSDYTDIAFPAPIPFADLAGSWTGRWENPTYSVSGNATGDVTVDGENGTALGVLTAWDVFGNPSPVTYTLDGVIGPDPWTVTWTARSPWEGTIITSNGQISGSISYPAQFITADVTGNYGSTQFIAYYQMVLFSSVNAEEYAIMGHDEIPVPVELSSFTGSWKGKNVLLQWTTATESNNFGFKIWRNSPDGVGWQNVGFVKGHGTTSESKVYQFTDELKAVKKNPGQTLSYRLEQIDNDGTSELSGVIQVAFQNLLESFSLGQNYPNPFNPVTTIQYDLPVASFVKLEIFNIRGELIRSLVNSERPAGEYRVLWDGKNDDGVRVSSGLYFYKIETNSFTKTRKMIFTR